jgi:hypothetical protein
MQQEAEKIKRKKKGKTSGKNKADKQVGKASKKANLKMENERDIGIRSSFIASIPQTLAILAQVSDPRRLPTWRKRRRKARSPCDHTQNGVD